MAPTHGEIALQFRCGPRRSSLLRLKDLREQAARRREKKSAIVDLQIKVLLNEVEGLGFFSEAASTGSPLIPVKEAFKRRTWNSNSPYAPIPTQPGAAPSGGADRRAPSGDRTARHPAQPEVN